MKLFPVLVPVRLLFPVLCVACGSVEVGQDHYYRLGQISLRAAATLAEGHLRIEDFMVSPHLTGDQVLVQKGESELSPYRYHHWAAPLDRMITDSVYRAFLDSKRFETVLDATDPGPADWALSGRILEFQEVRGEKEAWGRVRIAFTLRTEPLGHVLWQGEVEHDTPSSGGTARAVVKALDEALGKALERIAQHAERRVRAGSVKAGPGK